MIFLDMDEVLCDFVGAALEVHERPDLKTNWPVGKYRLAEALGMTEAEFWKPIDECGTSFWAELERHVWAEQLVTMCARFDEVRIVTLPGPSHHSPAGKVLWLQRHFGGCFASRYVFTGDKHLLAAKSRVLIDDSDANVEAFRAAGGVGILMPHPWNRMAGQRFAQPEDKLRHVREELFRQYK